MDELIANILNSQGINNLKPFKLNGHNSLYAYIKSNQLHICASDFKDINRIELKIKDGLVLIDDNESCYSLHEDNEDTQNVLLLDKHNTIIKKGHLNNLNISKNITCYYQDSWEYLRDSSCGVRCFDYNNRFNLNPRCEINNNPSEKLYFLESLSSVLHVIGEDTGTLQIYVVDNQGSTRFKVPIERAKCIWKYDYNKFNLIGFERKFVGNQVQLIIYSTNQFGDVSQAIAPLGDPIIDEIYNSDNICIITSSCIKDIDKKNISVISTLGEMLSSFQIPITDTFDCCINKVIYFRTKEQKYHLYSNTGQYLGTSNDKFQHYILRKDNSENSSLGVVNIISQEIIVPPIYNEISAIDIVNGSGEVKTYSIVTLKGNEQNKTWYLQGLYCNSELIVSLDYHTISIIGDSFYVITNNKSISQLFNFNKNLICDGFLSMTQIDIDESSCYAYIKSTSKSFIYKDGNLVLDNIKKIIPTEFKNKASVGYYSSIIDQSLYKVSIPNDSIYVETIDGGKYIYSLKHNRLLNDQIINYEEIANGYTLITTSDNSQILISTSDYCVLGLYKRVHEVNKKYLLLDDQNGLISIFNKETGFELKKIDAELSDISLIYTNNECIGKLDEYIFAIKYRDSRFSLYSNIKGIIYSIEHYDSITQFNFGFLINSSILVDFLGKIMSKDVLLVPYDHMKNSGSIFIYRDKTLHRFYFIRDNKDSIDFFDGISLCKSNLGALRHDIPQEIIGQLNKDYRESVKYRIFVADKYYYIYLYQSRIELSSVDAPSLTISLNSGSVVYEQINKNLLEHNYGIERLVIYNTDSYEITVSGKIYTRNSPKRVAANSYFINNNTGYNDNDYLWGPDTD